MKSTRLNKIIVILFLFLVAATVTYLTAVILQTPSIGVVLDKQGSELYVVDSIEPAGQGYMMKMHIGDRVVEVNGAPAHLYHYVTKYLSIEYADNVLLEKADGEQVFIEFSKLWSGEHSMPELLVQLYIPGISLILFFAFSVFLYMKRRNDPAAITLILFFISIGISYFSSAASLLRDPVGISIIYVVIPNIPLLFMIFMNRYVKRFEVEFISNKILYVLFAIISINSLVSLFYIWTSVLTIETFTYIKGTYSAVVFLGNLVCVYKLVEHFIKHRRTKLKSLFTITLVSHLVAFTPFASMNLLPQLIGAKQLLPPAFTALFLFVLPAVYFYLTTSNQLFDIDFILTRFKYYTALAFIPAVIVAAAVTVAVLQEERAVWHIWFLTFVFIYVGMTLFLYVKEQIDQRYRPKLFKAMYSYQDSLDRFSRSIARVMNKSDLETVLKGEISALLPVSKIQFVMVDLTEHTVTPIGDSLEDSVTKDFLLNTIDSFSLGELISLPYGLGLIIGRQRTRSHILWIGAKTNHTRFNSDEIRWLKTISNYASIVFENLFLIEGLIEDLETEVRKEHTTSPWVLRLLFCLSENERRKLAADLHDSALQDQLLWYRKLEGVIMDYKLTRDLNVELTDIKEGLLDVIHQIRETCNELRPPLLKEMGIVEAVESIIEHTQMRVNFEVIFKAKPITEPMHEEEITAIYRIVQELLRNADKHSQAKVVMMELEVRNGFIYFHYQDDGIGMDVENMEESFKHMGLSGIKERVASLEGEITFYSEMGRGLDITILFPEMLSHKHSERGISRDSYLIS